jgi:urease accessory protein
MKADAAKGRQGRATLFTDLSRQVGVFDILDFLARQGGLPAIARAA